MRAGGRGAPPPPSPFPSPNCEVAALPRGDPEQLLCNLGKGRGREGGEDEFLAQNAAGRTSAQEGFFLLLNGNPVSLVFAVHLAWASQQR